MKNTNQLSTELDAELPLLKMLLHDTQRFPLLSRQQEINLVIQTRAGDKQAERKLVESNIRYVIKKALKMWRPGLPLMDMVSAGCIGLMRAVKAADPSYECRLLTYAGYGIKHRILQVILDHRKHDLASLDAPVFEGAEEDTDESLLDRIVTDEEDAEIMALYGQLRAMVARLKQREGTIIEQRFFLDKTLDEVGALLGITGERVNVIEAKALLKLRWAMKHERPALDA